MVAPDLIAWLLWIPLAWWWQFNPTKLLPLIIQNWLTKRQPPFSWWQPTTTAIYACILLVWILTIYAQGHTLFVQYQALGIGIALFFWIGFLRAVLWLTTHYQLFARAFELWVLWSWISGYALWALLTIPEHSPLYTWVTSTLTILTGMILTGWFILSVRTWIDLAQHFHLRILPYVCIEVVYPLMAWMNWQAWLQKSFLPT